MELHVEGVVHAAELAAQFHQAVGYVQVEGIGGVDEPVGRTLKEPNFAHWYFGFGWRNHVDLTVDVRGL